MKTVDLKLTRTIQAAPAEVFDGWLDPKCPGTPWSVAEKVILDPKLDGLYYWLFVNPAGERKPHYGRFLLVDRPGRVQYTWVSPHTWGYESVVTVTFENRGNDTLLTLRHDNLPDDEHGRGHERGWGHLVDEFAKRFARS